MIKIIGEIGQNHNGDMGIVRDLIELSAIAGFNFVKFQKRNNDIAIPTHKKQEIKSTPWGGIAYYDYREKLELGYKEYEFINRICEDKKINWFASVWDIDSAKFMKELRGMVKIPSALITDLPLLKYCRESFSFKLMSTGMSTEKEIEKAVEVLDPDVVMHCNSSYPANVDELNLRYISWLQNKFPDRQIGYSGHEFGLVTTFATVSLGIEWIERHITLDRMMWGSDQLSSVEPAGMFKLIKGVRDIENSLGEYEDRKVYESEKQKRNDLRK